MREIIIASDAVEGTFANLDGKSLQEDQKGKYQREWKRSKGVDRNETRKEEKNVRCALLMEGTPVDLSEKESNSGGIRRNTGFRERRKECGKGRGRKGLSYRAR